MNVKLSEKAVLYRINNKDKKEINEPIGAYIKRERVAQGLNQDFVCKDICSVSYYSRIENNVIHPSNDYIEKIYKKLNKPVPKDLSNKKSKEQINNFLLAIEYRNENLIEVEFEKIKNNQNINNELYHFVYHTYHKNIDKLEHYIQILHKQQANFDDDELIIYLENLASYQIQIYNYLEAEKYLSLIILLLKTKNCKKPTVLYKYAWVLGKLNRDLICIEYANEADEIFIKNHNVFRSIQCQMLIAIKLSNRLPGKSIKIYENIIKITIQIGIENLQRISQFNLAVLYMKCRHKKKAELIFRKLIENYNYDIPFMCNVYIEFIDLLFSLLKLNEVKHYLECLKSININSEKYNFYIKYFSNKLNESNLSTQIALYKYEFIPYSLKTSHLNLQIRIRKEYVELLEENHSYEDCVNEFKKIMLLIDKNNQIVSLYKEEI